MADGVTFIGESGKTWRYWDDKPLGTPGAQAKADLREIVNDALSGLRAVEPDATSEERGTTGSGFVATPSFSLTVGGVRLRIDLWEGVTTSTYCATHRLRSVSPPSGQQCQASATRPSGSFWSS